jgi:CheY-like chemotaxis protein
VARILIVDDVTSIQELIKEVLLGQGHEFELAGDGAAAVKILNAKKIDLAIIDRNLAGMSGLEIVRHIRKNPKTKDIKVLMCTGSEVPHEIDEARATGVDDHIGKPISFATLVEKVDKALALPHR